MSRITPREVNLPGFGGGKFRLTAKKRYNDLCMFVGWLGDVS